MMNIGKLLYDLYQSIRKVQDTPVKPDEKQEPKPLGEGISNRGELDYSRQIRMDSKLFHAIQEHIDTNNGASRYASVASLIREALSRYQKGLVVVPRRSRQSPRRKVTTVRLNEELKDFWDSLPKSKRLDALELLLKTQLMDDKSPEELDQSKSES